MERYFGMDSFNRDATVAYCSTNGLNIDSSGNVFASNGLPLGNYTVDAISNAISADRVEFEDMTVGKALRKLHDRLSDLENSVTNAATASSNFAFVARRKKRLNREDLHLVWR